MAVPGTASPASGLTSAALPGRPRRERAGVSEAPGWQFDLRGSREPRAAGKLCALSRSAPWRLPPQKPRPLGLAPSATVHIGGWPEALTKPTPVTLGDRADRETPPPPALWR